MLLFDLLNFPTTSTAFAALTVATITILLVRYLQWHWNRRRLYEAAAKFNGPTPLPFIGNAIFIARFIKEFFTVTPDLFKKYGNPLRMWLGPMLFIGINDADDIEVLFNSSASIERSPDIKFIEILGDGLLGCSATIWKNRRKLIQPTMSQQIVDTFVDSFSEQSKVLADNLKKDIGKKCDIYDRVFKYTLDSICETSMGIKMNNQSEENVYGRGLQRYVDIAFMRMCKVWQHPKVLFKLTASYKILQKLEVELRKFSDDIIKFKRDERRRRKLERSKSEYALMMDTGLKKKTFIELLLDISDHGKLLTDKDIGDETATMIAAGSDTTANGNCVILLCLALYPEIQEKVYREVIERLGPDRLVQKEDLAHLKYLNLVIKESLRIFPMFPHVVRVFPNDVKLNNNKIVPAGTTAVVMIHSIQNDERYWEEPTKFQPERFLPENVEKRHGYAYMAFGAGPRNCIGKTYAMMSMKTTIAILVRKYKFFTDYNSIGDVKLKLEGAFTKLIDGYKIRFVERD